MADIRDRIALLIKESGLTNAEFAERIGTSNASISHVLNGRNKPGLPMITQILQEFTDVNPSYLLTGTGQLYNKQETAVETPPEIQLGGLSQAFPMEGVRRVEVSGGPPKQDAPPSVPLPEPPAEKQAMSESATAEEAEIEKILILYKDGSFRVYRP